MIKVYVKMDHGHELKSELYIQALGQDSMPSWLRNIYPYFIEPLFYISRLCTVYMVVVVSLERLHAVYSPLVYNSRCRYYISTAVFFSSNAYQCYFNALHNTTLPLLTKGKKNML